MGSVLIIENKFSELSKVKEKLKFQEISVQSISIQLFKENEIPDIIKNKSFDCIIICISKWENALLQIFKLLTNNHYLKLIPIIVYFSNNVNKNKTEEFIKLGAYDCLINASYDVLLWKVRNAIDYRKRYFRAKMFESYYISMFKSSTNACFILSKNLNIRLLNNSAMKLLNLDTIHIGLPFTEIFNSEKVKMGIEQVLKNKKYIKKQKFSFNTFSKFKINKKLKVRWNVICISQNKQEVINYLIIGEQKLQKDKQSEKIETQTTETKLVEIEPILVESLEEGEENNTLISELTEEGDYYQNHELQKIFNEEVIGKTQESEKQEDSQVDKANEKHENIEKTEINIKENNIKDIKKPLEEINKLKSKIEKSVINIKNIKNLKDQFEKVLLKVKKIEKFKIELNEIYKKIEKFIEIKSDFEKEITILENENKLEKSLARTEAQIKEMERFKTELKNYTP